MIETMAIIINPRTVDHVYQLAARPAQRQTHLQPVKGGSKTCRLSVGICILCGDVPTLNASLVAVAGGGGGGSGCGGGAAEAAAAAAAVTVAGAAAASGDIRGSKPPERNLGCRALKKNTGLCVTTLSARHKA